MAGSLGKKTIFWITVFFAFTAKINAQQDCDKLIRQSIKFAENKNYTQSFELLSQAQAIAEKKGLFKQQFSILCNIGVNHAEMLNYNEALDNFLEAYKIALKELDTRSEMKILNNIAGLYQIDNKYAKANEYYKKVFDYAKKNKDTLLIGGCAINIVLTSNKMKNISEADKYLAIAFSMLKKHPKELIRAQSLKIYTLILKKEFKTAEQLAINLLPQLNTIEYSDEKTEVIIALSKAYQGEKRFPLAIQYAKMALGYKTDIENKKNIFDLLSELHQQNHDFKKAIAYKDSLILAVDSAHKMRDQKRFENSRIKFELLKNEKELSESQAKLRTGRIMTLLSVFLIGVLIWAFINKAVKDKQRKKIVELELEQEKNNKLLLENTLREQKALSLLEQERLRNEQEKLEHEIELKNRELTAKALFLANRNELIESIVNSLSESPELSKNSKLTNSIHRLKNELKNNEEWESFITHFEQINQNFICNLRKRHPNLSANEIRFLSLVYINIDTKEVSTLLNITPEYCKKKKQQICQKLGLPGTTLLYNYLSNL